MERYLRWLLPEPMIYRESAAGCLAGGVVGGLGDIGSSSGLLYVLASAWYCICSFDDFGDGADSCHALDIEDCREDCL